MANTGRPTKLTALLREKIAKHIREGSYPAVAARKCGLSPSTFYRWLQLGKSKRSGPLREFSDAIKNAVADSEHAHVKNIQTASKSTWQASAWWLERRFPDRWALVSRREYAEAMARIKELEKDLATRRESAETAEEVRAAEPTPDSGSGPPAGAAGVCGAVPQG